MATPELHRPVPATWWLHKGVYFRFMLREWTCVAVGAYAYFLLELAASAKQPDAFRAFCAELSHPAWIAVHVVVLVAALYHTGTWFTAAGKVLVVRRGEEQVPPAAIVAGHWAGWLVTSAIVAGLVTWGAR